MGNHSSKISTHLIIQSRSVLMKTEFKHGVIYNGDCLNVMVDLPSESIDMIIADLPYGTTDHNWDIPIPFEILWRQYDRIIKRNGAIILTADQPFTMNAINSNSDIFRYALVWDKMEACDLPGSSKKPFKTHEDILVFYKEQPVFNPQIQQELEYPYPVSILRFKGCHNVRGKWIRTQKPVSLFEHLIKTYSNEGDIVLDNVIGSGTTAIAAYNTGRRWIGIEKDSEIFNKACERINRASTCSD